MPVKKTNFYFSSTDLEQKISDTSQVGGIETSIIDNGNGRGTRIAWFNTGTGFRYKVVIDRAMDIAGAFFNQYGLAWISNAGIVNAQPFSNRGIDWLRTFGGGLLTTCGLSHVGGPEKDEYGERGLHGYISNCKAEVESIIQPDPLSGKMGMSITGIIRESQVFQPTLELRRTISSELGEPGLRIHDEVTNKGNLPAPHMILYHFNLGWPLVDEGAQLYFEGELHYVNEERDKRIFHAGNDFREVPAPLEEHRGAGEAAAYFDIRADDNGNSICGIFNPNIKTGLSLEFNKQQLPWMTNWQHWAPREFVTALEPCTNPPIGQAQARKENKLLFIAPGETKTYDLKLNIITDPGKLEIK